MTIQVRMLTEGDDPGSAIGLLQRFFREEGFETQPQTIAAHAQRMLAIETCGLFLAEESSNAVGVATVSLEFGIELGWSAEMGDLYVLPEWRGRGASRLLVEAVEAFLRLRGAGGYQVTVTPYAEKHHALGKYYDKLGFASEGRLILYKRLQPRG